MAFGNDTDFLPELDIDSEKDAGFEPPLLDHQGEEQSVIGEYTSMTKLQKEANADNKATDPVTPEPAAPAVPPAAVTVPPVEAPVAPAEEELLEEKDDTDYVALAATQLKGELAFLEIDPKLVVDRENFIFVQDQFDFVKEHLEGDAEIAELHQSIQLADADLIYEQLEETYGALEDEEELLARTKKFLNEDGTPNERGLKVANQRRAMRRVALDTKVSAIKAQARVHAHNQNKFYKELEENLKVLNPAVAKFKAGEAEIDIAPDIKLTTAERRLIKSFMETEYLQVAEGTVLPNGKTKAQAVTENSFWLNEKVRNPWLERLLTAAYNKGRSDDFASKLKQ